MQNNVRPESDEELDSDMRGWPTEDSAEDMSESASDFGDPQLPIGNVFAFGCVMFRSICFGIGLNM